MVLRDGLPDAPIEVEEDDGAVRVVADGVVGDHPPLAAHAEAVEDALLQEGADADFVRVGRDPPREARNDL